MRCEDVRAMLPAYIDGDVAAAAPLEAHIESCADCSSVLAEYRLMLGDLGALRDRGPLPSFELLERLLASIPAVTIGARVRATAVAHPVLVTLASVGGATALGAAAAAIAVWRRRSMAPAT